MFDEGFSEEGSSMDDALFEGEEWLDGPDGIQQMNPDVR